MANSNPNRHNISGLISNRSKDQQGDKDSKNESEFEGMNSSTERSNSKAPKEPIATTDADKIGQMAKIAVTMIFMVGTAILLIKMGKVLSKDLKDLGM